MSVKTCSYGNELEFVAKCQTRRDDRLTSTYETGNIPFRLATRPSNQLSSTRRVNTTSSPLFSDSSMACEFFLEILFEEIGRLRSQGLFLRNFFPKNRPWNEGQTVVLETHRLGVEVEFCTGLSFWWLLLCDTNAISWYYLHVNHTMLNKQIQLSNQQNEFTST